MPKPTDIRPVAASVWFLPVQTRVPLKFGPETLTQVTVARVMVTVTDRQGRTAEGWGETPLSVQWVWPSALPTEDRLNSMKDFCRLLAEVVQYVLSESEWGHPIEISQDFMATFDLPSVLRKFNISEREGREPMPHLAALVCYSPFDIALHDAFGKLHGLPVYETYNERFMSRDLGGYLTPADGSAVLFEGLYPKGFLSAKPQAALRAWHLVGGVDLLDDGERKGGEPEDGYPVTLREWIRRDGLECLKVKLRGNDTGWDYERLMRVGRIFLEELKTRGGASEAGWLTADFNCTVTDPAYVNDILDRLRDAPGIGPRLYQMLLYIEQPFPYELEQHPIDVHSVSARKPLFMDESAHDWKLIRLGRSLGWTGVALKTCKTQTGAILSACWAKAHGMTLMVQDLTNPMLAMIPHVLLAAHAGTIMGVEVNAMQFYPEASKPEEAVHPGLFKRRNGRLDLSTIRGPGFGYRLEEMTRELQAPAG